jgi:multiple sugar transport system substrate-binding protein
MLKFLFLSFYSMTTATTEDDSFNFCFFFARIVQFLRKWVILLLIIFLLSACSYQEKDITTVTLSGWQSNPTESKLIEKVLQDFEAKYPNIQVKFETIGDRYMDVIKTRLIGDAAPDVFYLEAFEAPLLMTYGVLEPLDDYITSDFALKDFQPSFLKAFKYRGKIYGLPKDFSTLALFYNQQLLARANLNFPPQTWQQLQDYSQKLTGDRIYGLGIEPDLARQYFLIKAFGGKLVDRKDYAIFAKPKSIQGLQNIVDWYRKDRTVALPSDVGTSSDSEMFGQGKVAMVIQGNWAIPYLQETFPNLKFSTAELPTIKRQKNTIAYTVAYVMNKQAKNKDAAWKLISYLTGKEGMKAWAKGGAVLPSRRSVLAELGYSSNPLYAPFIEGSDYATIWQAGINLPILRTHFNNQFLSTLLGEQSLKTALTKAQNDANKEIQLSNY